jgi:hypothetical protein
MKKKLVIDVGELPLRPKKLSREEIAGVYGGCIAANMACSKNSDCCSYGESGPMGPPVCVPYAGPHMKNPPAKVCLPF